MTLRSMLKDSIRLGLDLSARMTARLPRGQAARVLTYHEVLEGAGRCPNPYNQVSARRLSQQIDRILGSGYIFVTVSDLASSLAGPARDLNRTVSLTFDDGLQEHRDLVLPILVERKIAATFYVLTGSMGRKRGGGTRSERYLDEEEIRALAAAGMEIGSHGREHTVLSRLDPERLHGEVSGSRDDLERVLGRPPTSFAYPYGSRATYGPPVVEMLRRAGYANAVSSIVGANRSDTPLYELRRIPVYDTDDPALALARVRGAYDWTGNLQEAWLAIFPHHSTRRSAE